MRLCNWCHTAIPYSYVDHRGVCKDCCDAEAYIAKLDVRTQARIMHAVGTALIHTQEEHERRETDRMRVMGPVPDIKFNE